MLTPAVCACLLGSAVGSARWAVFNGTLLLPASACDVPGHALSTNLADLLCLVPSEHCHQPGSPWKPAGRSGHTVRRELGQVHRRHFGNDSEANVKPGVPKRDGVFCHGPTTWLQPTAVLINASMYPRSSFTSCLESPGQRDGCRRKWEVPSLVGFQHLGNHGIQMPLDLPLGTVPARDRARQPAQASAQLRRGEGGGNRGCGSGDGCHGVWNCG